MKAWKFVNLSNNEDEFGSRSSFEREIGDRERERKRIGEYLARHTR